MQEYNKLPGLSLIHSTLARAMPRFRHNNIASKPENQEVVVQSATDPTMTRDESGLQLFAQPVQPQSIGCHASIDGTASAAVSG